jgi:hypothetical protein
MTRRTSLAVIAILAAALHPIPLSAQTSDAVGVVTTLDGRATVARPAIPSPLTLKFKDDVFGRDKISTAANSLVRVLLGGKAILTVRELSQVTISEEPGRAVVTLPDGKVVLAVAKQRMRPGESIEIRTPNAAAAVRGSILAVAYDPAQNLTTAICHSGDCTYQYAGGATNPLPPGQGAKNGQTGPVSANERNAAVNVQTNSRPFTSPDPSFQNTVFQNQTTQAIQVTQFLNPGSVLPPAGPPTPPMSPANAAPVNALTNTPIESGIVPGSPPKNGGAPPGPTGNIPGSVPNNGGAPPPPPPGPSLLVNGGFESGLLGWSLTGVGGVISALGAIKPPEGQSMGLIYSSVGAFQGGGLGPSLNPPLPAYTDSSTLTQSFAVTGNSLYVIKGTYNFLSNEFPTQATIFDDRFEASVKDPAGPVNPTLLALERRNASFSPSTVSPETASAGGFTIAQGNGVTGFKSFTMSWVPTTSGQATLTFQVGDVGDTNVQSAVLLDAVSILLDPPRSFVGAGDILTSTQRSAWAQITNQSQTFDSLLVVCCGGRASLAGPLLQTTNSDLTVPFGLVSLIQGGSLVSTSTDPLVLLQGGTHRVGSIGLPMFDVVGVNTATEAQTGLTLGTDRPLQIAGPLLETSGATLNAYQAVRIDTALLEASAPLLSLRNGSHLTSTTDAVQLSYQAKVTSLGSLVKLDRSTLTIANGAALNVAGGSLLRVTGDLFSLTNGSTLQVLSGPLVSLSRGSILSVNGSLIGFGGTGGNGVSVANSLCPCATIGGIPVSLTGGALASNVSITGAIKNGNLGSLSLAPNAAVIRVDGAATKVTIKGM